MCRYRLIEDHRKEQPRWCYTVGGFPKTDYTDYTYIHQEEKKDGDKDRYL